MVVPAQRSVATARQRRCFPRALSARPTATVCLSSSDGWGHPISSLSRRAPGFGSDIQLNLLSTYSSDAAGRCILAVCATDHDPFDLFHVESKAFRLVPLIYSTGRDEDGGADTTSRQLCLPGGDDEFGESTIRHLLICIRGSHLTKLDQSISLTNFSGAIDSADKAATDNINNHLISTR